MEKETVAPKPAPENERLAPMVFSTVEDQLSVTDLLSVKVVPTEYSDMRLAALELSRITH